MARVSDLTAATTKSKLRGLQPLLVSWSNAVLDFCKSSGYEDNPWWYNERASLSLLAGAAWRMSGWTALEEFSTTKRGVIPEGDVDSGHIVRGRCDLYVAHRSTSFAIEAKQAWQSIGSRAKAGNANRVIDSARRKAWADAGKLTSDEANHRLAITFVVPYLPVSEVGEMGRQGTLRIDERLVRGKLEEWRDSIGLSSTSAYAYVFPRRSAGFINSRQTKLFPGTLILVERRQRGSKQLRR